MPSRLSALCFALVISVGGLAAQGTNPDVIVGDLNGTQNYGVSGSEVAYAIGTTSCNIGTTVLVWIANTNAHPVIGQNMYRLKDNRFEQLGLSWLKHGFTALQQNLCSPCTANPNGSALGVGCSDPYSAGLNGQQSGLGPRFEVNATTGVFPYPYTSPPIVNTTLDRRLRVRTADVNPSLNSGARYFVEGQYIHRDDAGSNNDNNNSSYREVSVAPTTFNLTFVGNTVRQQPAIMAWAAIDPTVRTLNVDIANDGRFIVAWKSVPSSITPGMRRYEFAIHNLNSHRSASGISFNFPCATASAFPAFKDVDYHSGEPFTNTDWTAVAGPLAVSYTNDASFAQNPNANALRWGTLYNFWFEAAGAPTSITFTMFRPGTPTTFTAPIPPATGVAEYQTNPFTLNLTVDGVLSNGATPAVVNKLRNQSGTIALSSFAQGQPWELLYGVRPLIPRSACALVASDGQVINIDLQDPAMGVWWNLFQSPPFRSLQTSFALPAAGTLSLQAAILNPTTPSGVDLSQAVQINVQ